MLQSKEANSELKEKYLRISICSRTRILATESVILKELPYLDQIRHKVSIILLVLSSWVLQFTWWGKTDLPALGRHNLGNDTSVELCRGASTKLQKKNIIISNLLTKIKIIDLLANKKKK